MLNESIVLKVLREKLHTACEAAFMARALRSSGPLKCVFIQSRQQLIGNHEEHLEEILQLSQPLSSEESSTALITADIYVCFNVLIVRH